MTDPNLRQRVLSCGSLPTPPVIAVKLLELTRDPDVRIKDIARLVENDQALAGKVLRLVNSSLYGLPKPCQSIERALGLLGLSTVKSLVLGFSVVESTKSLDEDDGFDTEAYWTRVIYGSTAARILAQHTRNGDPDEVFTAALFQDMGMMACHIALGEDYDGPLADAPASHEQLPAFELEHFGFTHAEIGGELATKWKLPEEIAGCIRCHHKPDDAPSTSYNACRAIELGRLAAEAIAPGAAPAAARRFADRMREDFDTGFKEVDELLGKIASAGGEMAKLFEKSIGEAPDVASIMAEAQELSLEHQLSAGREAERLKTEAFTDGLTGAANRKKFDDDLAEMMQTARDSSTGLAMIFLDADKFKSVNDTHGHQAGDAVLVELAKRLEDTVGQYGTVYRYGGEEFAALFEKSSPEQAERFAELARSAAAASAFDLSAVEGAPDKLPVTISVGAAVFEPSAEPELAGETLLKRADEQVYAAKQGGRDTVRVHGRSGEPEATTRTKTTKSSASPGPSSGLRVLLVEDDALAATLVRVVLSKRKNVTVTWINAGDKAIDKINAMTAEDAPDVVLTDLQLPGATGVEIVAAIRAKSELAETRAIVFTATPDEASRKACQDAGADMVADKVEVAVNLPKWLDSVLAAPTAAAAA